MLAVSSPDSVSILISLSGLVIKGVGLLTSDMEPTALPRNSVDSCTLERVEQISQGENESAKILAVVAGLRSLDP